MAVEGHAVYGETNLPVCKTKHGSTPTRDYGFAILTRVVENCWSEVAEMRLWNFDLDNGGQQQKARGIFGKCSEGQTFQVCYLLAFGCFSKI